MMKSLKTLLILAGLVALLFAGCVKKREIPGDGQMRGRSIEQVFDSHRDSLLSIPGVVGAGIAKLDDMPSIMVMVQKRSPDLDKQIPKDLDGYSVKIEEISPDKTLER